MTYQPNITIKDKTQVIFNLSHHVGEQNRVDVDDFAKSLDISRRTLRAIVHEINCDATDHLILTDTTDGGIWLADETDPNPAVNHYYEEESRAMNTLKKAQAMKHKIARIYGEAALNPNARLQERLC